MKLRRARISAFLLDMLFVVMLTSLMVNVYAVNPYLYDSEEAYKEYTEVYNESVEEIDIDNPKIPDKLQKAMYKYEVTNKYLYLWYIAFGVIYFVVFQWLNKGQTLGKKFFKLRVVNKDEDNPSLLQYVLRYLINGSTFLMGVNIIVLVKTILLFIGVGYSNYYNAHMTLQALSIIIEVVMVITLIVLKNNKMFNDIVAKTKVIEVN